MRNRLLLASLAATFIFVFTTTPVFAVAWTYEQTFESLSLAALTGQDSWTGTGGTFDVSSTQAQGGTKSVQSAANNNSQRVRAITDVTDEGEQMFFGVYISATTTLDNFIIFFYSNNGATQVGSVQFNSPLKGDIAFRQGAAPDSFTDLGNISAATWYCIGAQFNFAADTIQVNIDGGGWSSSMSTAVAYAEIDAIWIGAYNGDAGSSINYLDNITATAGCGTATAAPAPAQALIFFGLLAPFTRKRVV